MGQKTGIVKKTGQVLLEYVLLFSVVLIALSAMQPIFQRRIQAIIKVVADDFSNSTQGKPLTNAELAVRQQIYKTEGNDARSESGYSVMSKATNHQLGGKVIVTQSGYTMTSVKTVSVGGDFRPVYHTAAAGTPPGPVSVQATETANQPKGTPVP